MASILRSEVRNPSDLFQKLDPSLQTSLLQKMHHIDCFESVVLRAFRINQLLKERLQEFKSGTISTQEIVHAYHEICEKDFLTLFSDKKQEYYQSHLVSVLEVFFNCDLSQDETSSKEKVQQASQTCLQGYEDRIEEIKRAILKAAKIRDELLHEIETSDTYLTILGKQQFPVDLPANRTTITAIANTFTFLIEDYSPPKDE
jgi:hypothetical protein